MQSKIITSIKMHYAPSVAKKPRPSTGSQTARPRSPLSAIRRRPRRSDTRPRGRCRDPFPGAANLPRLETRWKSGSPPVLERRLPRRSGSVGHMAKTTFKTSHMTIGRWVGRDPHAPECSKISTVDASGHATNTWPRPLTCECSQSSPHRSTAEAMGFLLTHLF